MNASNRSSVLACVVFSSTALLGCPDASDTDPDADIAADVLDDLVPIEDAADVSEDSAPDVTEDAAPDVTEDAAPDVDAEPSATVYSGPVNVEILTRNLVIPGDEEDSCEVALEFVVDASADPQISASGSCFFVEADGYLSLDFSGDIPADGEGATGAVVGQLNGTGPEVTMTWNGTLSETSFEGVFEAAWEYLPGTLMIYIDGRFTTERP